MAKEYLPSISQGLDDVALQFVESLPGHTNPTRLSMDTSIGKPPSDNPVRPRDPRGQLAIGIAGRSLDGQRFASRSGMASSGSFRA